MTTEPSVQDLSPVFKQGVEYEPVLIFDTSGSMSWPNSEGDTITRWDVVKEAIPVVIGRLASLDSQAAAESSAAGDDEGGVMTFSFSDHANKIGDLRTDNVNQALNAVQLGGGTTLVPAWDMAVDEFLEEFGDRPKQDRPHMLAIIVTDGEASDSADFEKTLAQQSGGTYVVAVILGYGELHDKALKEYNDIAVKNNHVRVVSFGSQTDPKIVSDGVLSLMGNP